MRKICNIYRSEKEEGMYLYVDKKDELLSIPEDLLKKFGKLSFVDLFLCKTITPSFFNKFLLKINLNNFSISVF